MTKMYICKHMKYKMIKSSQLMYLSLIYIFIEIFEFFLTAVLIYVLFLILAIFIIGIQIGIQMCFLPPIEAVSF